MVRFFTLAEVLDENRDFTSAMDFLIIDTQGAEAEAIEGLGDRISQFKYIFSEVSTIELYKKSTLFKNYIKLLDSKNFELLCSYVNTTTGWGDALFVRKHVLSLNGYQEF